jgi:hypothetical protein
MRSRSMDNRALNAFSSSSYDRAGQDGLAIARNLERIWSSVLHEPIPADLQRLIRRLEAVTGGTDRQASS